MTNEQHVAEFDEHGWGMQHPVGCRPNLLDCRVHRAMQVISEAPGPLGRYIVLLDDDGALQFIIVSSEEQA